MLLTIICCGTIDIQGLFEARDENKIIDVVLKGYWKSFLASWIKLLFARDEGIFLA